MAKIKILGEEIELKERELKVNDLDFWPQNPRVYSQLRMEGDEEPDQKTIEEKMKSLDNVKDLRQQILQHGSLIEPIYVRNNVVIEGNSRLAAYRLLFATDVVKWGKIRCYILPEDFTDDQAFALIGLFHIKGKKEWNPFEQAGFLYRHQLKSKKPLAALAKEIGLKPAEAQLLADTYSIMLDYNDSDQDHWSYYYEMLKKKSLRSLNEERPSLRLIDRIVTKIKGGTITHAADLRNITKIVDSKSEDAISALNSYLNDEESLQSAVSKVSVDEKKKNAIDVTAKFREQLTDKEFIFALMKEDEEFRYEIGKIFTRLKKFVDQE